MTIALAGYGYVGRAIHAHMSRTRDMAIIDPLHGDKRVCDVDGLEGVIVCVPTPQAPDGSCDAHHIVEVLDDTPEGVPVLIKSTVSLDAWELIRSAYPKHEITYCPEFLRAASAQQDVANSDRIILGGGNVSFWIDRYAACFDASILVMSPQEAIAVKYFRNAFLAMKVSYFNQVADFCASAGIEFEMVRTGVAADRRIGASHTFMNEQGARGWGGACFPKDTRALLHMADIRNVDLPLLQSAVDYNDKVTGNGSTETRPAHSGHDRQASRGRRLAG